MRRGIEKRREGTVDIAQPHRAASDAEHQIVRTNCCWRIGDAAHRRASIGETKEGDHVITVIATDSFGLTNGAALQIRVLRQAPPRLSLRLVGDQVMLAWTAAVSDYVLEASTSLAPDRP